MSLVENVVGIISNKDSKEYEIPLYDSLSDISTVKALQIKYKNNTYYAEIKNVIPVKDSLYIKITINGEEAYIHNIEYTDIIFTNEKHQIKDFLPDTYNTVKNIKNKIIVKTDSLYGSFEKCTNLTMPPELETSAVTNMADIFHECRSLKEIDSIDMANAFNVAMAFGNCSSLEKVHINNIKNKVNFAYMFHGCKNLTSIDIDNINESQSQFTYETNTTNMFYGCRSLTRIPNNITSIIPDHSFGMFNGCCSLNSIPSIDFSRSDDVRVLFQGCSSLTAIHDLDIHAMKGTRRMFAYCENLEHIDINIDLSPIFAYNLGYINELDKPIDPIKAFFCDVDKETKLFGVNSDYLDEHEVATCFEMFQDCNKITGTVRFSNVPLSIADKILGNEPVGENLNVSIWNFLGNASHSLNIEIVNTVDN